MTRIHGLVFIIIGAVVAIYSYSVDLQKLKVFLWIGIVFLAFGIIRLAIDNMHKPAVKKKLVANVQQNTYFKNPIVTKFCHNCGTGVHNFQNFCHNCGVRMFH